MVLMALLITGAYSVSAALGSAMGGRTNAAAEERSIADSRQKAQDAYVSAKSELDRLPATRSTGELRALIAAAQRNPRMTGCDALNGSLRVRCPKIEAELARARQREKLKADMDKAT